MALAARRSVGHAPLAGMRLRPEPQKRLRPSGYDRCRGEISRDATASARPALLSGVGSTARSTMGSGEVRSSKLTGRA
jgi:hypothetical protein